MEFTQQYEKLKKAVHPEDFFGDLAKPEMDSLSTLYSKAIKLVHPDRNGGSAESEEATKLLNNLYEKAQDKVKLAQYGDKTALTQEITISAGSQTFFVSERIAEDDIADLFRGRDTLGNPLLFRIVRSAKDNDLMKVEVDALKHLISNHSTNPKGLRHVAQFVTSFTLHEAGAGRRQVNVFQPVETGVTLAQVIKAYPKGVDPRDAVWMFNRLLGALIASESGGLIHGAVLPINFQIVPSTHDGVLSNWSYSLKPGEKPRAVIKGYRGWYPPEYFNKQPVDISVDIYMAAMTMIKLLGGNPETKMIPIEVPHQISGLLRACLLGPASRTRSAFELWSDFKKVLDKLWARKFRPFSMPTSTSK